jgi:hypothetical protein
LSAMAFKFIANIMNNALKLLYMYQYMNANKQSIFTNVRLPFWEQAINTDHTT